MVLWAGACLSTTAATISYLGVQTDVEAYGDDSPGWRTATTLKSYDPDGDQILGTDGYRLFPSNVSSLPSYVTGLSGAPGVSGWPGSGGYALVDNPAGGADIVSGVYYFNGISGGESRDMFSFTLGGTIPAVFVVHLMAGASDNANTTANTSFHLLQTSGGSGTASAVQEASSANFSGPDWYSFQISGATAGDVFTLRISNDGLNGQNLQVGGIAFDTVPEPSGAAHALGLVAFCLILRRRPR
jgi:hypothetical protein